MISHNIINKKETVKIHIQQGTGYAPPQTVQQLPYAGSSPGRYLSISPTQLEYDEWLKRLPIKKGDYVTLNGSVSLTHHYQVHYVAYVSPVCPPFNLNTWETGDPKVFTLISTNDTTATPWIRKEAVGRWRKLTDEEYKLFVEPNLDKIRHYLDPHLRFEV